MILLAQGAISELELRLALAAQNESHERIGAQLARCGLVNTDQITAALATQWQCPAVNEPARMTVDASSIPLSLMRGCRMAPLGANGKSVIRIMFDGPIDHGALYAIDRMLGCRTLPCIGSATLLEEMLCRAADQRNEVEVHFGCAQPNEIARTAASYAEELSGGEIRYVSFGGRFWMRIPRHAGTVNLVFSGNARVQ
jgi:hypothetical protein